MHPATPAQPVTAPALELCPPRRFESALRLVLAHHTNGTRSALMRIGGPAAVARRYAGEALGNATCMASPMLPGTQWPLTASSHHLLINAGTGTTGTRWLHCILAHLGARAVHHNARMAACTRNCTYACTCCDCMHVPARAHTRLYARALRRHLHMHAGVCVKHALGPARATCTD